MTGNFDKGGMPDIAVVSGSTVNVLSENANGVLSVMHTCTMQQPGVAILASDLNGDGNLNLVVIENDSVNWSYGEHNAGRFRSLCQRGLPSPRNSW